jgi:ABC-type lipoprotein release transport system permease subunit
LITAAAVMFAVFFSSTMRSLQEGAWAYLVNNVVSFHIGYLQIQDKDYWENPNLDKGLDFEAVSAKVDSLELGNSLVPRIENFALGSFNEQTKAMLIVGTDMEEEDKLTGISERVSRGSFIDGRGQILVAEGIADYLDMAVGDSLIVLSQGRHGTNAVGLYRVQGTVSFGSPELNNQLVYIGREDAEVLFNMKGLASSVVINVKDESEMVQAKKVLKAGLGGLVSVKDYKELIPEIMQAKEFDKLAGRVILTVLYFLISFSIFGTILMMLKEREYEFGILKAIGMKTPLLYGIVWLEGVYMALLGAVMGIMLAIPIIIYFSAYPIEFSGDYAKVYESFGIEAKLPFKFDLGILVRQAIIVTLITTLMTTYAWNRISRLKAVNAMRR